MQEERETPNCQSLEPLIRYCQEVNKPIVNCQELANKLQDQREGARGRQQAMTQNVAKLYVEKSPLFIRFELSYC